MDLGAESKDSSLHETNAALLREALTASENGRMRAESQNTALRTELAKTQEALQEVLERRHKRADAAADSSTVAKRQDVAEDLHAAGHVSVLSFQLQMRARLAALTIPPLVRAASSVASSPEELERDRETRRRAQALGISCDALFLR